MTRSDTRVAIHMARVLELHPVQMRATAKWIGAGPRSGPRRIGDRIEKYELVLPVARGGMGSVWAAKLHGPHGFEKIVAIKTVLPELAGDPSVRAMFLDEARLASAIDHRNVARVLDFLEHEGALYLVMEWVDGTSLMALHERVARGLGARIPVGVALRIVADVCAGLHAAHELRYTNGEPCGVVHRDVSPQNVLVAIEGSAKLIDFGVAKTRLRMAPDSTLGALRGRIDFMAPEQALSDPLDRRADIWSVGAALYHVLAGHGPFGPCERTEALRRLLRGAPPLPPPSHVPDVVASVLSGCLALRREDRFPTAERLGSAIEEAIVSLGVAATARDVAEFLAERGVRPDQRLVVTGRCAIPRDLTSMRPDTVSGLRPTRRRATSRPSILARSLAVLACAAAIGLGIATVTSSKLAVRVPVVSSPAASPAAEGLPPAPRDPTALAAPVVALARVDLPDAHASRSHTKLRPLHPGTPKEGTSHERLRATP
jgi:serine/threonine protein kinase